MNWKKREFKGKDPVSVEDIILYNMQITSRYEINDWYKKSNADQYRIDRLDEAVSLIRANKKRAVHILGDYDVDGKMASVILKMALEHLGYEKVSIRIPRPFSEGYGMNTAMVEEIEEDEHGVLIITVDNGIQSFEALSAAKRKGYLTIVTDHHLPAYNDMGSPLYPDADIIIDPHAIPGSADFDDYCGAGLAWRLADRLLGDDRTYSAYLLPFAATATICDSVSLTQENYVITRKGIDLLKLRKTTPGFRALLEALHIEEPFADSLAFGVGPCINATRRLHDEDPWTTELLMCDDHNKSISLAGVLTGMNATRKNEAKIALEKANKIIQENGMEKDVPIVIKVEGCGDGLIGLIAGSITEKYHTPALVYSDCGTDILRGSARSVPEVDINDLLNRIDRYLVRHGGHAAAAGMAVDRSMFDQMREAALRESASYGYSPRDEDEAFFDMTINVTDVTDALTSQSRFEPFGMCNPKPVFKITGFKMGDIRSSKVFRIGEKGVKIMDEKTKLTALNFTLYDKVSSISDKDKEITLYGTLGWNVYRGEKTPQIEFLDVAEC